MNPWDNARNLTLRLSGGPDRWAPVHLEHRPGFSVMLLITGEHAARNEEFARRVQLALAVVEGVDDDALEYALSQGLSYRELGRILGQSVAAEGEQD